MTLDLRMKNASQLVYSQVMFLAVKSCLSAVKRILEQTTSSVNTPFVSKMMMVGLLHSILANSYLYVYEPFVVGFVETTYTVDESVGAVEVCVNLTRPMIDILDERVNVFVIDYPSSVYIPPGAPLASESSHT